MWEIDNSFQAISFLYSLIFGIGYCLFYDIFRAFRKHRRPSGLEVFFEDILYFLVIAFTTFLLMISLSDGEIRAYIIIGITLGFVICHLTVSRLFLKILCFVLNFFEHFSEKAIDYMNKILMLIFKKLKKCAKYCENLANMLKKLFKKDLKKEP